jgi:hypothetical protein
MDPVEAQDALVAHLEAAAPWGVRVNVERESSGEPFQAHTGGPAYAALAAAMEEAYGRPLSTLGQGGSIPLCNVFADTYPNAEIILMGVEEPLTLMHAPNEGIHPDKIANMALTDAPVPAPLRGEPLTPPANDPAHQTFQIEGWSDHPRWMRPGQPSWSRLIGRGSTRGTEERPWRCLPTSRVATGPANGGSRWPPAGCGPVAWPPRWSLR